MEEKLIVVTGFGPFAGHELVNASWEAVQLLPDNFTANDTLYKIEKQLVPVVYEEVDKTVDEIWNKKPELVVHCGVHGGACSVHLEKLAYNNKFCRPDYLGKKLSCATVCLENNGTCCESICTTIDVDKIVCSINGLATRDVVLCSKDVGDYLCGYIYLRSLDKSSDRCLFIHVPPINKPFSSKQTSEIIFLVIKECIAQIVDKKD